MARRKAPGKREWKPLRVPPTWIREGVRATWHFVMSYEGDGRACTITSAPYQLASGDWLVRVKLDEDGRTVPAAIESLDQGTANARTGATA